MNQHKEAQTILGEYIQRIIDRAVKEPAYRALLFSDPGTVLGGYPLTHEERMALARLVPESWHFILNDSIDLPAAAPMAAVDAGNVVSRYSPVA